MKALIEQLIAKHTKDLNTYKENRAKAEEEKWSEKEIADCEFLMQRTATFIADLKSMLEVKTKKFYLFGSMITRKYFDYDFEDVLAAIKDRQKPVDYSIAEFDPMIGDPSDLLEAADGWGGSATISEEEYNQIKELRDAGY